MGSLKLPYHISSNDGGIVDSIDAALLAHRIPCRSIGWRLNIQQKMVAQKDPPLGSSYVDATKVRGIHMRKTQIRRHDSSIDVDLRMHLH